MPDQRVVERRFADAGDRTVVRVVEEDRPRLRQVQRPVPVRQVGRDDPAEREAEVARPVEVRLYAPLRPRPQIRRALRGCPLTAEVMQGSMSTGPGQGVGDVRLPARVDHDAALAHRVPDERGHRLVAGELVVAVHDDRERGPARSRPGRLEHVPRGGPAAAGADPDAPVCVVAPAGAGLGLRRLRDSDRALRAVGPRQVADERRQQADHQHPRQYGRFH